MQCEKTFLRNLIFIPTAAAFSHRTAYMWPQICYPEASISLPTHLHRGLWWLYFPFLWNVVTKTSVVSQLTNFCEFCNLMCRNDSSDPEKRTEALLFPAAEICRLLRKVSWESSLLVSRYGWDKSRSCLEADKREKKRWKGRRLQGKKGFDKDMHREIIHCTCSDNVQKPNTGFPGQDDTCINGAAAAGCWRRSSEQLLSFCAQTLD